MIPSRLFQCLYTNCCSCSSPHHRVVPPTPSALYSLSDSNPPAYWASLQQRRYNASLHTVPGRFSPSTGCPYIHDVFLLRDPRQRRRRHQDRIWTSLWLGSFSVIFSILYPLPQSLLSEHIRSLSESRQLLIQRCLCFPLTLFFSAIFYFVCSLW